MGKFLRGIKVDHVFYAANYLHCLSVFGSKLGSVGGAVVIILATAGQANSLQGIVCSLISVVFWSLVSVYVRRITKKYGPVLITALSFSIAFVCVLPAAAIEFAVLDPIIHIAPTMILGSIYLGSAASAAAMFLWNKSLSLMEAGRFSLFTQYNRSLQPCWVFCF